MSVAYSLYTNLHVITSQKNAVDYKPVSIPTGIFQSLRTINNKMTTIFMFACNACEISGSCNSE